MLLKHSYFYLVFTALAVLALSVVPGMMKSAEAQGRIAASVNNGIVTNFQVTQRARFLRVTGFQGNAREEALRELINEELQFQEAERVNFSIPDRAVDRALSSIASRLNLSASQFAGALRERGVNPVTLRQRLRAQLTWQQIVIGRTRARNSTDTRDDITSILFNRNGDGQNRRVQEYTIDRYVFVVQRDASDGVVQQKMREAEAFRQQYNSCTNAEAAARQLKEVVVTNVGRFTSNTLPDDIRGEVLDADVGTFTAPRRGELGIGIMAVCNKREIVDNSAASGDTFDVSTLTTEELQKNSEAFLEELRELATITIRDE